MERRKYRLIGEIYIRVIWSRLDYLQRPLSPFRRDLLTALRFFSSEGTFIPTLVPCSLASSRLETSCHCLLSTRDDIYRVSFGETQGLRVGRYWVLLIEGRMRRTFYRDRYRRAQVKLASVFFPFQVLRRERARFQVLGPIPSWRLNVRARWKLRNGNAEGVLASSGRGRKLAR